MEEISDSSSSSRFGTASTSAPALSNNLTIRRSPSADARQSAVRPSAKGALTSQPDSMAARTPALSRAASATSIGLRCPPTVAFGAAMKTRLVGDLTVGRL